MSEEENDVGHEDLSQSRQHISINPNQKLSQKWEQRYNLAQRIPVLSLKNRQIPKVEITTSNSPARFENLSSTKDIKNMTLVTPIDRNKILNKKNCNSDIDITKNYENLLTQDSK